MWTFTRKSKFQRLLIELSVLDGRTVLSSQMLFFGIAPAIPVDQTKLQAIRANKIPMATREDPHGHGEAKQ